MWDICNNKFLAGMESCLTGWTWTLGWLFEIPALEKDPLTAQGEGC